jgi:hypothetical protein
MKGKHIIFLFNPHQYMFFVNLSARPWIEENEKPKNTTLSEKFQNQIGKS